MTRLKRYSKARGAGDQTSGGRGKLLRATTALSRIALLIRETLQNSWDARDEEWYPAFGARVYRIDDDVRPMLQHRVFTDRPDSMRDLTESMADPDLHVIEIFDRGTSGLDGPYRASEVAGPSEPNNFNSFVFDIGTTKASDSSGGTYGFGKTATFEVSQVHSVVYWSRCRGAGGELEYRLIAASLHDPYDEDGARFTGAHWWGDPADEDIVPLRGPQAQRLGEQLFRTHFGEDETGTSIMVIDPVVSLSVEKDSACERTPVRTEEQADVLTDQIFEALAFSAWPKMIPADGAHPPMIIKLFKNGIEQDVASHIRDRYERFAYALDEIRRVQGQRNDETPAERPQHMIRVSEPVPITLRLGRSMVASRDQVFGDRDDNVVGHLYMTESVRDAAAQPEGDLPNSLCLMRSEAELVVRYDEFTDFKDDFLMWHGVFKPTPECDRHFAAAEPPTHDNWNPSSAEDEVSTYVVDRAMRQVRRKAREFLEHHRAQPVEGRRSVRGVATSLRHFVPLGDIAKEVSESPTRPSHPPAPRSTGPQDSIEVTASAPSPDGYGQIISLTTSAADGVSLRAAATIFALTADGRMPLESGEIIAHWYTCGTHIAGGLSADLEHGVPVDLELRTRVASALEVDITAGAVR